MIFLVKDGFLVNHYKVGVYELRRKRTSNVDFEMRDLLEVETEYRKELVELARNLLYQSEYYEDDIRLNSSYTKKMLEEMQSKLIKLSPLYKYLQEEDSISRIIQDNPRAISSVYTELGLIECILERVNLVEKEWVYCGDLSRQDVKRAEKNTQVLKLFNKFSPSKITW